MLVEMVEEIESIIEDMTPLLTRCGALRRLRFPEEWYELDPKEIVYANVWLKNIRKKYWLPCANYYVEYTEEQWDVILAGPGKNMPSVKVFRRDLKALKGEVISNQRPFFFKIALTTQYIKDKHGLRSSD